MNALQLHELEEVEQTEQRERFKITDIDSLNWAFRKLSAIEAKKKEIQFLAQKERDRIDQWEAEQVKSIQGDVDFFTSLIHEYHQKVLADDPKSKTISTPYGKTKARVTKEQPEKPSNDEELIQHVKESGQHEFIKESLKWGEYKKSLKIVEKGGQKVVVDDMGQVVECVKVKPESVSYTVEIES